MTNINQGCISPRQEKPALRIRRVVLGWVLGGASLGLGDEESQ